jgi:hypothetical protein
MTMTAYRDGELKIEWQPHGLIGQVTLDGEHWANVEWSEKQQRWCIEDCEGRCLMHVESIQATAESRWAAAELAEAMIRDGRMPTPAQAKAAAEERRRADQERKERERAQRAGSPSAQKQRPKRQAEREAHSEALSLAFDAERREKEEPPLYEILDESFDLADPDLWKSNSFAALKPRLIVHVETAIAKFAYEQFDYKLRRRFSHDVSEPLERAKAIYRKLTGTDYQPPPSRLAQWRQLYSEVQAKQAALEPHDESELRIKVANSKR